ncbi:polysaccharide deacetylase family protein [Conexibacter woesei]|uniref:Uncharacterized protein n=1 Tax=Conexibacter woesei (strain DSM 14684 / CCUG 47730 / CIP 108061 / JCM 11494 / NBRC 100937 / ID131577) TaxID=469383 RepID=D3F626_CONWI|nr:hypothetical protein [Conexibacter woesei]ADB48699.1 hypothetical protein Cwoe_0263 [Conexibacter woesei DSM 14684]
MPDAGRSEPTSTGPWGPDGRRAAVAIVFAGLAGTTPEHPVTPALPTLLRVLGDRDLPATFCVEAPIAASEPFALSMVGVGAHELAALAPPSGSAAPALDALAQERFSAAGVLLPAGADADPSVPTSLRDELTRAGVSYLAAPAHAADETARLDGDLVRIPIALDDGDDPAPSAFHLRFQATVGSTLARGGLLVVALRPSCFERQDALDVLVESLDLLAGLRRAERLWTPRLRELADALGADQASPGRTKPLS